VATPITFSGFNQIDFSMILNAVMQQESAPLTRLDTQKKALETQKTLFGTLSTKLGALKTASDALKSEGSLGVLKATSSGPGVEVSAANGTNTGTYNLKVTALARAQVLASATFGSLDDVVATGGAVTITPATGDPVVITVTESMTIQDLAKAINNDNDSPISAAVVQSAPGVYRLVLTGKATGEANAFTLTHTLSGGAGLTFADTDGNQVYGDFAADDTQSARNASFTVNGLPIESTTNVVQDVVPGVTLTLRTEDPDKTVVIDVTRDSAAAKAKITAFIDAYNAVASFYDEQQTAAIGGKPSIGRDPIFRGFRNNMRQALQEIYPGGAFTKLAAVGLGFDNRGKLTLDEKIFAAALDSDPDAVQDLMAGPDGNGGAFAGISTVITGYTTSGGLIADMRDRITEQVKAMNNRLDQMEQRLAFRRATLQREFTAADNAMTQLNSQGNSLNALSSQYRLF
jgi:flagellar hook-associated protein 2